MTVTAALVVLGVLTLTGLGLRDMPNSTDENLWTPRAIAGLEIAARDTCTRCHKPGGSAPDLARGKVTRDDPWISRHLTDPEMIVPGLRPAPPTGLKFLEVRAVIAYVQKIRVGLPAPQISPEDRLASEVLATRCMSCHAIDGEGGEAGPELTHAAKKPGRDAAWIERWIKNPGGVDPNAEMLAFSGELSDVEVEAIASYLAKRH